MAILSTALGLAVNSPSLVEIAHVATRYGTLTIEGLANHVEFGGRLLFKGQPLQPDVRGNSALSFKEVFHLAGSDAVLLENEGGTGCPYTWRIVAVTPSGATPTREFGTCGPLSDAAQKGQTIVMHVAGFCGPLEPESDQARSAKEIHEFTFRDGVVTGNDKNPHCR